MRPLPKVRCIHNTPIGPTGAAIEKPIIKPRTRKPGSIFPSLDNEVGYLPPRQGALPGGQVSRFIVGPSLAGTLSGGQVSRSQRTQRLARHLRGLASLCVSACRI